MRALLFALLAGACYDLDAVTPPSQRDAGGDAAGGDAAGDAASDDAPAADADLREPRYLAEVDGDGPIAHWRLGELTAVDDLARDRTMNHDGTYFSGGIAGIGTKCTLGAEGIFGPGGDPAVSFDDGCEVAVDDAASGGAFDFAGRSPFTLECWISSTLKPGIGPHRIFGKREGGEGYILYDENNLLVFARYQTGAADALTVTYQTGIWKHLVATYDGTQMAIYLDGIEEDTLASSREIQDNGGFFGVGGSDGSGFRGLVDECAVYDEALLPARIAAHASLRP